MTLKLKLLAKLFCILIAVLILSSCENTGTDTASNRIEKYCVSDAFLSNLDFIVPTKTRLVEEISLTGSVEPNPDKVITFISLAGGIISNTYFSLGDYVDKGQLLAELRSTELSDLYAQSKTIASQIKVADKRLASAQSMYDDEISSQKELMEVESELEILKAEQEKINANLSLYSASPDKGIFQIKAPHSGIITSKSISTGAQIAAGGDALFVISDLEEVWIMVNIYASNVQDIKSKMDISIKTLSYPDELFEGKISAISQVLDAEAKVLKARVVLPNPQLKLKPGMLVDVIAQKQGNTESLSIPISAIVFDNNRNYVVIYHDACSIEVREVEVILKNNGMAYISSGLNEDDKVISKNQLLVFEQIKNYQY
ncbi:efflux RND transporter periplasmic adaptor subunit [Anditalea andensis]|uniref:RND transporter n=1 Tax=Anditalea andensis TaxID=1048983 RepID=A0A074LK91_9BACT|nr:efflux RND transporter periplasmic adaptor subunit [Anditalea andensis]KEO74227.1 RND transporter [Anditalea andensis]